MKKLLIVLLVAFVIIQFFPIEKTNPPVNKGMDFLSIKNVDPSTTQLIRNSCYDCHSHETKYPWYASIAPSSWILKNHIDDARKHFNFSLFATYEPERQIKKLEEAAEEVAERKMPLESYYIGHQDAKLSDAQRKQLVDFFLKEVQETKRKNALSMP